MQSTDQNRDHSRCPVGEDSWCGFQRDVAKKTKTYTRKNPIPKAVASAIYPVFEALTTEELLSGCLHGGTKNQNEAFNALIWQRATKETHSSLPTVQLATYLAVGTSMMDPEQFYLCWKILVLTQESIQQMLARRLTKTGFDTRDERALTHIKSAGGRSDKRKRVIMKPKRPPPSMRLLHFNW